MILLPLDQSMKSSSTFGELLPYPLVPVGPGGGSSNPLSGLSGISSNLRPPEEEPRVLAKDVVAYVIYGKSPKSRVLDQPPVHRN